MKTIRITVSVPDDVLPEKAKGVGGIAGGNL